MTAETKSSILSNTLVEGLLNLPIILFIALLTRSLEPYIWLPTLMLLTAILITSFRSLVRKIEAQNVRPAAFMAIWVIGQLLCIFAILNLR